MAHKWESVKQGYSNLWAKASILPQHHAAAIRETNAIIAAKPVLITVEKEILYPWYFLGCLQGREAGFTRSGNLNTNAFLGNGQPLDRITTEVPQNLGPFKDWAEGAYAAISHELHVNVNLHVPPEGITAPFLLYFAEEFNGEGYYLHGINSPYVWSFTSLYSFGKFSTDHGFNPSLVDPQCGVAAYLLALCELDTQIAADLKPAPKVITPAAPTPEKPTMNLSVLMQLLPVLFQALETIIKATGGNSSQAASALVEHLTPGQPNHPALS